MNKQQEHIKLSKKGAVSGGFLNSIPQTMILIIITVILGVIIALTMNGFDNALPSTSQANNNLSITFTGNSSMIVDTRIDNASIVLSNVSNNTIFSNNYLTSSNGSIIWNAGAKGPGQFGFTTTMNVSYNHLVNSAAENIVNNASIGAGNVFVQYGTIGTVIGTMVILAAILYFLGAGAIGGGKRPL